MGQRAALLKKGDTVSSTANDSVKDTNIRAGFMLNAIVKLNSSAFIWGNPHWMLAGSKLKFSKSNDFSVLFFARKEKEKESGRSEDPFAGWIR